MHPALIYATILAVVLETITTEGFWDGAPPNLEEIRGPGSLMWKLQEKAFAELAAGSFGQGLFSTV